jgi:hypothetical protein
VGSAEPRAEVRRLLESAVGRLLMEGLSWDEVVDEVRRRLGGGVVEASPAPAPLVLPPDPDAGRPAGAPVTVDAATAYLLRPEAHFTRVDRPDMRFGEAGELPRADEPGEPPVGSVVTDTRTRVCWRDAEGWHRAGTEGVLSWSDVVESVGGPPDDRRAKPGQPTIVSQPERRAQGPMVTRSAGRMELPVQRAVLDDEGKPRLVQWWQDRLVDVPSTVRWSQQAEKQMFAEHVCSAPRDGVPGLDHYAVIRTWMGDKIAWVELATPDFNRRVELSEGNAGEKDWYVIGLCRR